MTPQERRVMDNLVTAVDFLLSDTPRSGRHNEVKAIRESLQEANADLKETAPETSRGSLSTILVSQPNRHGKRVVVRQQNNRLLDDQLRFMTEIQDAESGRFFEGHYLMTMDKAYADFLERCEREECKI